MKKCILKIGDKITLIQPFLSDYDKNYEATVIGIRKNSCVVDFSDRNRRYSAWMISRRSDGTYGSNSESGSIIIHGKSKIFDRYYKISYQRRKIK